MHFTPHKSHAIEAIRALETCSPKATPVKHQEQDENRPDILLNNPLVVCLRFDRNTIVKMGL